MSWGLEGASVRHGARRALDAVTIPAVAGTVTVVVGGDGAGKTTALRLLVGLARASAGTVRRPAKREIGYVPATAGCYPDLTVEENLAFSARAYGIAPAQFAPRAAAFLERTDLGAARRRLARQLSGGMRRKLAVGMALLHRPALLVLDEPTTGIDPVSRVELWRLIAGAAADGAAVVVATTYVNEAARATCTVVLDEGRVLASGPPDALVRDAPGALGTTRGAPPGGLPAWRRGPSWHLWAPDGVLPSGVTPIDPDLEDVTIVAALAAARTP